MNPFKLTRLWREFRRDRRGNVAMIFALSIIPIVMVLGMAVDLGNAMRVRLNLQDATDSAVLAVARDGLKLSDAKLKPLAKTYLDSSYGYANVGYTIDKLTFDRATVTAVLDTSAQSPTTFMSIFGFQSIPVSAHAVSKGLGFEIALVLDNSGSMAQSAGSGGSKINALKTASDSFLDVMFGTNATSSRFTIGIVPFAASVNVGTGNSNASWIQKTSGPKSKMHTEDYSPATRWRFQLFSGNNGMKNTSWAGCVMTPPPPYDTEDTTPTNSDADTIFVPWFAPDEPDGSGWWGSSYPNDYLDDEGGNCSGSNANSSASDDVKQARVCKYKGESPDTSNGKGPNYNCTTTAITPLTGTRSTLNSAIDAMQANGNTNIFEGLMWGWRVLSANEPFTQGKLYTSPNNRKVIILMTDGENVINGQSNMNKSDYTSFGYIKQGRLGTTSSSDSTLNSALNTKTLEACTNAKKKGIVIYTIAFGAGASGAQNLLRTCATDPSYFYMPQNSSDLTPVFIAIAQSINRLRIAE